MRIPRTFEFVDLSGFTNYTAEYGDDAAGRILSAFRALVREIASERGVRIAKWLGDGCMIVSVNQGAAIEFRGGGEATNERELLESGAARIDPLLSDQQLVNPAMLESVGRVWSNLGEEERALPPIDMALAIRHLEIG